MRFKSFNLFYFRIVRYLLLILLLNGGGFLSAQTIDIGLFAGKSIQRIDFSYLEGSYLIQADTSMYGAVLPNEFIAVTQLKSGKLLLRKGVREIGRFDRIQLLPTGEDHAMRVRPRDPVFRERKYRDGFTIQKGQKGLTIINNVSYQHYLSGVIESEGGAGRHLEYYKAQAVISRTYAMKHARRHEANGFNLCDQVHCQAYHNMMTYDDQIAQAVQSTAGVYMIDTVTNQLVDGYFHANCGGQTSPSDYVWREGTPYLKTFKDTFCIYTRQATWEKKIPKLEWRRFLINNYFYPIADSIYGEQIYTFEQEERKAFYISPHLGIPLRDLRYHFKLKSTFFSCSPEGKFVVLKGRGYGHGVGLCQEGAMRMAHEGLKYRQILSFYFDGIAFEHYFHRMYFEQDYLSPFDF